MAKLTEKEVHQAASELDAQGIKPSVTKIREKLGRGSFSTIQQMLINYESQDIDEPSEVPEELKDLLPAIWAKCESLARDRFNKEMETINKELNALKEERESLIRIINENDDAINEMEKIIEHLELEMSHKSGAISSLEKHLARTEGERDTLKEELKQFFSEKKAASKQPSKNAPGAAAPATNA